VDVCNGVSGQAANEPDSSNQWISLILYGFTGPQWIVRHVEVGAIADWISESDHLPMVLDMERTDSRLMFV
jgi:hypothetical protein